MTGAGTVNNTVLTANGLNFRGLGTKFFLSSNAPRQCRDIFYSERLSFFVLCGAANAQNETMVWSRNPMVSDKHRVALCLSYVSLYLDE